MISNTLTQQTELAADNIGITIQDGKIRIPQSKNIYQCVSVQYNQTYTLSAYVLAESGSNSKCLMIIDAYDANYDDYPYKRFNVTSEEQLISFTFTYRCTDTSAYIMFSNEGNSPILLSQPKLEIGEGATAWCLNEQDKKGADGVAGAAGISYTIDLTNQYINWKFNTPANKIQSGITAFKNSTPQTITTKSNISTNFTLCYTDGSSRSTTATGNNKIQGYSEIVSGSGSGASGASGATGATGATGSTGTTGATGSTGEITTTSSGGTIKATISGTNNNVQINSIELADDLYTYKNETNKTTSNLSHIIVEVPISTTSGYNTTKNLTINNSDIDYELRPSVDYVLYDPSTKTFNPTSIRVSAYKDGIEQTLSSSTSSNEIKGQKTPTAKGIFISTLDKDGNKGSSSYVTFNSTFTCDSLYGTTNNSQKKSVVFEWKTVDDTILDREEIPLIVKGSVGATGATGVGYTIDLTNQYINWKYGTDATTLRSGINAFKNSTQIGIKSVTSNSSNDAISKNFTIYYENGLTKSTNTTDPSNKIEPYTLVESENPSTGSTGSTGSSGTTTQPQYKGGTICANIWGSDKIVRLKSIDISQDLMYNGTSKWSHIVVEVPITTSDDFTITKNLTINISDIDYELRPSVDYIVYDPQNNSFAPTTISVTAYKDGVSQTMSQYTNSSNTTWEIKGDRTKIAKGVSISAQTTKNTTVKDTYVTANSSFRCSEYYGATTSKNKSIVFEWKSVDGKILDREEVPFIINGSVGAQGEQGYPGLITRVFRNVLDEGAVYRNDKNNNPTNCPEGVGYIDYFILPSYDPTTNTSTFKAYVHKATATAGHTHSFNGSSDTKTYFGTDNSTEWGKYWVTTNVSSSAFFESLTALTGNIQMLSSSGIVLTDDKNEIFGGFVQSNHEQNVEYYYATNNKNDTSPTQDGTHTVAKYLEDPYVLWTNGKTGKDATFSVKKSGELYCTNGLFQGAEALKMTVIYRDDANTYDKQYAYNGIHPFSLCFGPEPRISGEAKTPDINLVYNYDKLSTTNYVGAKIVNNNVPKSSLFVNAYSWNVLKDLTESGWFVITDGNVDETYKNKVKILKKYKSVSKLTTGNNNVSLNTANNVTEYGGTDSAPTFVLPFGMYFAAKALSSEENFLSPTNNSHTIGTVSTFIYYFNEHLKTLGRMFKGFEANNISEGCIPTNTIGTLYPSQNSSSNYYRYTLHLPILTYIANIDYYYNNSNTNCFTTDGDYLQIVYTSTSSKKALSINTIRNLYYFYGKMFRDAISYIGKKMTFVFDDLDVKLIGVHLYQITQNGYNMDYLHNGYMATESKDNSATTYTESFDDIDVLFDIKDVVFNFITNSNKRNEILDKICGTTYCIWDYMTGGSTKYYSKNYNFNTHSYMGSSYSDMNDILKMIIKGCQSITVEFECNVICNTTAINSTKVDTQKFIYWLVTNVQLLFGGSNNTSKFNYPFYDEDNSFNNPLDVTNNDFQYGNTVATTSSINDAVVSDYVYSNGEKIGVVIEKTDDKITIMSTTSVDYDGNQPIDDEGNEISTLTFLK